MLVLWSRLMICFKTSSVISLGESSLTSATLFYRAGIEEGSGTSTFHTATFRHSLLHQPPPSELGLWPKSHPFMKDIIFNSKQQNKAPTKCWAQYERNKNSFISQCLILQRNLTFSKTNLSALPVTTWSKTSNLDLTQMLTLPINLKMKTVMLF